MQRPTLAPSSEDELGQWSAQETYQQQVKSITRQDRFSTPKLVDLDQDMSDDELALPFKENIGRSLHPMKEFIFHSDRAREDFLRFGDEKEGEIHDLVEEQPQGDEIAFANGEHVVIDDLEEHPCPDDPGLLGGYPEDDEMSVKSDVLIEPLTYTPLSPFSSPQSSRPPSPDESKTLYSRSAEEQSEIQREMKALYDAVPELKVQYQLLDRLGTGTFSSVYKAIDLLYDDFDNRPWLGNHPPESTAYYQSAGPTYKGRGGRGPKQQSTNESRDGDIDMETEYRINPYLPRVESAYVAIKRIYTTSGPDRIRNELSILETCRGCRHSSQIITAFRHNDQVVIVLPYQRNMEFRVRGPPDVGFTT